MALTPDGLHTIARRNSAERFGGNDPTIEYETRCDIDSPN